jgi:hypothetical protein
MIVAIRRVGKRVSPQDDFALRRLTAARVVVHDIGVIFSSGADSQEKHEHAIDIDIERWTSESA